VVAGNNEIGTPDRETAGPSVLLGILVALIVAFLSKTWRHFSGAADAGVFFAGVWWDAGGGCSPRADHAAIRLR
jgi:hypothetical protein